MTNLYWFVCPNCELPTHAGQHEKEPPPKCLVCRTEMVEDKE